MSDAEAQTSDLEPLREELQSGDLSRQWKALNALAADGGPAAVELISAAIRDADDTTAARAANLVSRKRFEAAVPALIERLEKLPPDTNPTYSSLMLHALAVSPGPAAMPVLAKYVTHPNRHVRLAAARSLAAIGTPEADQLVSDTAAGLSKFSGWRLTSKYGRWAGSSEPSE